MKVIFIVLLSMAMLTGCGPGKALQPLHGETPAIAELMETKPEVLQSSAPYQAARKLLESVRNEGLNEILPQLSTSTQQSLRKALGEENFASLRGDNASTTIPANKAKIEKALFGITVGSIGVPTPRELTKGQTIPHEYRANVRILSPSKTEHWAIFVFESGAWKLQQKDFDQIL